jgi:transposase
MRESYPSDVSRIQFEKIRSILEGARKKTRPRKLNLYNVFCGVLYVTRTGCQWRMPPRDYPKWSSVYAYFRILGGAGESGESIFDTALKKSWLAKRE